jgi:hypothetical protein
MTIEGIYISWQKEVSDWYRSRGKHPEIRIDLREVELLSADTRGSDLGGTDSCEENLTEPDLRVARCPRA